jgi:hypothetical protein
MRILNCQFFGTEAYDGEDYCTEFDAMVQKNAQFLGYCAMSQRKPG